MFKPEHTFRWSAFLNGSPNYFEGRYSSQLFYVTTPSWFIHSYITYTPSIRRCKSINSLWFLMFVNKFCSAFVLFSSVYRWWFFPKLVVVVLFPFSPMLKFTRCSLSFCYLAFLPHAQSILTDDGQFFPRMTPLPHLLLLYQFLSSSSNISSPS